MARGDITVATAPGSYATAAVEATWTDGDAVNNLQSVFTGGEIVLVHNTDSGSHTATIQSVGDTFGREGDLVMAVPAGEIHLAGPFRRLGWQQSDGKLYIDTDDATLKVLVIRPE
jgi:hypothetical protein